MAEKTLNTRIILRNANLADWNSSELVLKKGEIALAAVTSGNTPVPTYVMKVGDGSKTFKELNYLAAPAADVSAWAKKEQLELSDIPTLDAAHIPTLDIEKISGLNTRLQNLEGAVGTGGSVDTKIEEALALLDVTASADTDGVVIASIGQVDGKIEVTRRALKLTDLPELNIKDIKGLETALSGKVESSVYNQKVASLETAIQNETSARAAKDTEIEKSITELKTAIGNVTNIMNFRGAVAAKGDIADPVEGDVIVVTDGEDSGKEFVYSEGAWVEFGSVTAQDAAIANLKSRMDAAESNIAKKANQTDLDAAKTTLQANIDAVSETVTTNKSAFDTHVNAYTEKVAELEKADSANDAAVKAAKSLADTNAAAINVINGEGEGSIAKALADAKAYADTAEADAVKTANAHADSAVKALTEGQVATNKSDIGTLKTKVAAIEADYLKAADTYIFDCGGAV